MIGQCNGATNLWELWCTYKVENYPQNWVCAIAAQIFNDDYKQYFMVFYKSEVDSVYLTAVCNCI